MPSEATDKLIAKAIPELLTVNDQKEFFTRVMVLSLCENKAIDALLSTATLFDTSDPHFPESKSRVAFAISNMTPPPIDRLIAELDSPNPIIRDIARDSLGRIGDIQVDWTELNTFFDKMN